MFNELCLIVILSSLIGRWVFQPFGWIIWVVSGLLWIISSFQGCCSSFPEFIFLTIQSQSAVLKLLSSNSRPHFDWFPYRFADDDCYFGDLWVVVGSVNSIREEFCFCSTIPSIRSNRLKLRTRMLIVIVGEGRSILRSLREIGKILINRRFFHILLLLLLVGFLHCFLHLLLLLHELLEQLVLLNGLNINIIIIRHYFVIFMYKFWIVYQFILLKMQLHTHDYFINEFIRFICFSSLQGILIYKWM